MLIVGHRGMGANGALGEGRIQLRENTVASLQAAGQLGAHLVEFDVQVTADLVPVLWHDWTVPGGLTVPQVDLDELRSLSNVHDPRVLDGPLATLSEAFEQVDPQVGFNIEIKYPLPDELDEPFPELHAYLQPILQVIRRMKGDRTIFISSFHPEVCLVLKAEFNVLFLTSAGEWKSKHDARCNSLEAAIEFASEAGLSGIVSYAGPLIEDHSWISRVQSQGLQLWSWGALNNDPVNVHRQRDIDALICDDVALILAQ